MSKHGQPMSQVIAEMQIRELKMNDPKLNKIFDKLKKGNTVKIKHSSTLDRGKDFIEYIVKSKNVVNKGRVEKITLASKDNPTAVKKFLYKRDGKVTFAVGDMAASIDDIKEKYSVINHEIIEDIEEVVSEMAYKPGSFKDTRPQEKGAKAFDKLIQTGGLDKKDFQKARQLYVQASDAGSREKLKKFIYNLDTEPTEAIMDLIGRNDPETFVKMYPKSKEGERLSTISYAHRNVKAEEVELDEGFSPKEIKMAIGIASDPRYKQGNYSGAVKQIEKIKKGLSTHKQVAAVLKRQNENLDEKYDLYHKSFSDAMQHAYDYAKKKMGITVDPKEIDSKVATGPKKPSEGKTNKYRLKGRGGNLQIQVYNKGGSKPFELNMYKEALDKEDEPKVKEIIKKLKGASDAHAGQAKDLEKAIDEGKMKQFHMMQKDGASAEQIAKALKLDLKTVKELMKEGNEMTEKLTDGNLSLKDTVLKMWQEAVSPAQQAAIAISKKEKEKKEEPDEGNAFGKALNAAKEKGEKTFTVAGKEYDVKTEKLVGGQKKLDKDKDGDIDGKDFAMMRKKKTEEFSWPEYERYLETKKGSLRESVLKMWGEVNEKVEYVEYKFKNEKDAKAAKSYFDGIQIMSFDVNDDNVRGGELSVDAGSKDMTKYHKEVMKKFKPKVMKTEKNDLTKETKDGKNKMTDTGKEMTPVEMAPKMPKVKNEKNKV